MALLVLISLSLLSYAVAGNGTRCFECSDLPLPAYCANAMECPEGQLCMVKQFITSSGMVLYDSGCRSTQACSLNDATVGKRVTDVTVCTECCHGEFCNNQGCGSIARQQPSRGPLCFQCDYEDAPDKCRTVATCAVGEVCMLTEISHSGQHQPLYKSSCQPKHDCSVSAVRLMGKKKRAAVCHTCCTDDFCNDKCSYVQHTLPTTHMTPPLTSAATSTATSSAAPQTTTETTTHAHVPTKPPTTQPAPTPTKTTTHEPAHTTTPFDFRQYCHTHHYHYDGHSDTCYYFHGTRRTWQDAENHCQRDGGTLAIADTAAKWNFLRGAINNHYNENVYIGAHDTGHDHYHWLNGAPLHYNAWARGQPDGGNENCVYVYYKDHSWHDTDCRNHMAYACTISRPKQ